MAVVNLSKGSIVNLSKSNELDVVFAGANWGAIRSTKEKVKGFFNKVFSFITGSDYDDSQIDDVQPVDLDLSAILYTKGLTESDTIYYGNLMTRNGSIQHSGDDRVGDTDADDVDNETIKIQLSKVNKSVKYIVIIVNSYTNQKFDEIPYIMLRIYNSDNNLARFVVENESSKFKGKEAMILGYFYRSESDKDLWKFKADGTCTEERSISIMTNGSVLELLKNHCE